MAQPTFTDYVQLIYTLLDRFTQAHPQRMKWGRPLTYDDQALIVFFTAMQLKRKFAFKSQQRWLDSHPNERVAWRLPGVPDRTWLSRRYKALYPRLQEIVAFFGRDTAFLDTRLVGHHWYVDKSLFKAQGPVWHQRDRKVGRIPPGLRHLDQEATWAKSAYQGWVYGYSLHLLCTSAAFPTGVQVETAAYPETRMFDEVEAALLDNDWVTSVSGDNSYTQARRIRRLAKHGLLLLTPASKWRNGRYAAAYHRLIQAPKYAHILAQRRTTVEPLFDLVAKVIGATNNQKQLPLQGLANVRTCLALATFSVQIAMIANSIWGLPLRAISPICVAAS
jgi:hypothetical protein